jgi:hypothetical protein
MAHRPGNVGHDSPEPALAIGRKLGERLLQAATLKVYVETDGGELLIENVRKERAVRLQQIGVHISSEDKKLFWANRDYQGGMFTFEFPYGPKEIKYGSNALEYSEVMRPSRKPLLRSKFPKNRTVSLNAVIAHKASHGFLPCEDQLSILYRFAGQDKDLVMSHGGIALPFHVRITSLNVTARRRNEDGLITQAKVGMTLKESISINQELVFLTAVPHEPEIVEEDLSADPAKRGSSEHFGFISGDGEVTVDPDLVENKPVDPYWDGGPLTASGYHG